MNEVTIKPSTELAEAMSSEAWGVKEITSNDIILPKILPMQGMSKLVMEEKAAFGEFRNSLTDELMGKIVSQPLDIIPFHSTETFDIQEKQADGKFKYIKNIPIVKNPNNPGYNDNAQWNEVVNGVEIKRVRRYDFYCLLPSEISEHMEMPYIISFKSTSAKEGKKLFSLMYVQNRMANLSPAAFKIQLDGIKEKNDDGTFVVLKIKRGERASTEEVIAAKKWFDMINGGKVSVKVHEEDSTESSDVGVGSF